MSDHSEFVALAQELITFEGRAITLQTLSATPVDAAKPWNGPTAPTVATDVDTFGVFLPVASASDMGFASVTDDMLKRASQLILVAPTATDMRDMTRVLDKTVVWTIEWVQVLEPGDQLILYAYGVSR